MKIRVEKQNFNNGSYRFDLSNISDGDWAKFAFDVLIVNFENIRIVKKPSLKTTIRDNVAKVELSWFSEKDAFHDFIFHLDEFGIKSENYQDLVSNIWQIKMTDLFGEEYDNELNAKLSELKSQTV